MLWQTKLQLQIHGCRGINKFIRFTNAKKSQTSQSNFPENSLDVCQTQLQVGLTAFK